MTLNGIDVAHWQAPTWSAAGLEFIGIKAFQPGFGKDARYEQHLARAKAARLVTVAYAFGDDRYDPAKAARDFYAAAGTDVDGYALDVEGAHAYSLAQARVFIAEFHRVSGRRIGLYMSEGGFFLNAGQDWNWVANWARQPRIPFTWWQNASGSTTPSHLDTDICYLSMADMLASIKGQPSAPESDINMGLDIELNVTKDSNPYGDLFTAVVDSGSALKVSDGTHLSLTPGTSLGVVQTGVYNKTDIFAFNSGGSLYIIAQGNCRNAVAIKAPVTDDGYTKATQDAAVAKQAAADKAAIDAANADRNAADARAVQAEVELAGAAETERNRIAAKSGAAEESRIKAL